MNGGLASPTARRLAPTPSAGTRAEPVRAPARQAPPRLVPRRAEAPTMRERLEAAAAPGAADLRAVPDVARPEVAEEVGTEPTVAPLAPAVTTTRERIVNRALPEPARPRAPQARGRAGSG